MAEWEEIQEASFKYLSSTPPPKKEILMCRCVVIRMHMGVADALKASG